ncbi:XAC2610-related protein [Pedobacter xixiisoli]|uniref:Uncharacterized protein n=1 Tax=Pedobacter xixiisoli TaxID=1476464 RepID=A0A285ZUK9_9SPHI|nr:hypothetical protein [Pedobacter xixiisoli]SOD13330.1 hypothetical protein SAMN06297358_1157 [Pedobacter xixiisoli]
MIKRTLLILLTTITLSQTYAQKAKVTANLNFTGTVGNYPVEMSLKLTNYSDSVSGTYYYVKSGRENYIYLSGTLKDGDLVLNESTYNVRKRKFEHTGYFRMAYVAQTTLNGIWEKDKKNTDPKKTMVAKLKSRELLNNFNPLGFDFVMSKNKPNYDNVTENAAKYFTLLSLRINVNKSSRWILNEFDKYDLVNDEVELEDVNFDGYLDIKVPIHYPDLAKNDYSYVYFIYDVKTKGFRKSERLNELGVVSFNPVKKEIEKTDADGSGNEGTAYYKWYNGKLLITKEIRVYENDSYTHYDEYKIENGNSVKMRSYKKKG